VRLSLLRHALVRQSRGGAGRAGGGGADPGTRAARRAGDDAGAPRRRCRPAALRGTGPPLPGTRHHPGARRPFDGPVGGQRGPRHTARCGAGTRHAPDRYFPGSRLAASIRPGRLPLGFAGVSRLLVSKHPARPQSPTRLTGRVFASGCDPLIYQLSRDGPRLKRTPPVIVWTAPLMSRPSPASSPPAVTPLSPGTV